MIIDYTFWKGYMPTPHTQLGWPVFLFFFRKYSNLFLTIKLLLSVSYMIIFDIALHGFDGYFYTLVMFNFGLEEEGMWS